VKIVVFVEGSGDSVPSKRENGALARIWCELLPHALGLRTPARIVPISKGHITAMTLKGAPQFRKIGLDHLIAQQLQLAPFDAAVVVWDLLPPWDPKAAVCRWEETLALYRGLAASEVLPQRWRRRAHERLAGLQARPRPNVRVGPHAAAKEEVAAVCMEPMFEAVLQHEPGIFRALGLKRRPGNWPADWKGNNRPDRMLLAPAVRAAQASKKRASIVDKIGGDMTTRKNEWGAYFLETLLADETTRAWIEALPLARRLREVMR
jgi:hypothetical protein